MRDIIGTYEGVMIWECEAGFYHKCRLGSSGVLFCEHTEGDMWFDYLNVTTLKEITDEKIIEGIVE